MLIYLLLLKAPLRLPPRRTSGVGGVPFGLGLGAGAGVWVLLGWTGLVLLCTAQNPARLVYGSAALVASLRGQQSHFATLPITKNMTFLRDPFAFRIAVIRAL